MSLDLHNALIEQLTPLLMEPNFHALFEQLTAEESNSTRFLLKMELNRLASSCARVIDLRNKTDLECETFEFGTQTHFIDQATKANFLEALALYREQYTLGVYEQVIAAHKARVLKARTNADIEVSPVDAPYTAQGIVLGSYFARCEERMNYSMKIEVSQTMQQYLGITVDLSVGGARIRLPAKQPLNVKQPIKIKLLELSDDYYHQDLQQGVEYEIVDIEGNQEYSWLRLKRISGSDALADMLRKLIRGHKYRYKVDVNDVLVTTRGLGFERHYLPHIPHLALFIEDKKLESSADDAPLYQPTHMLLGRDNQAISQYFKDESGISQINALLTPSRLHAIICADETSPHSQLFCFTFQAQGGKYFYSATLAELQDKQLQALFFSFGATKPSWRIFHVARQTIDHSQAYRASLLPGDDASYNALTEAQLAAFTHVIQLIDVTNHAANGQYQIWKSLNNCNVNELKVFGQQKLTLPGLKQVSMEFSERRNEARFAFRTPVVLSQGNISTSAYTQDISSKGLQITTDTAVEFNQALPIGLSFPKLQTIAGKVVLQQLPYRLIRTRKNGVTLHLAAQVGHTPHVGVEFLNRLIEHNKSKFQKLTENNHDVKELADGMKNLLMRKLVSVPFYLEKTVKSAYISTVGIGVEQNPIANIFATNSKKPLEYDLAPLFQDGKLKRDIIVPIRTMKPQNGLAFYEVYVQISRLSQGKVDVLCITDSDFKDTAQLLHFIQQSRQLGEFMALRVYRGATGKPDLDYIRREREYIKMHALHKGKKLEEQLWRVIGVGELLDISREVILRFPELITSAVKNLS
ncbi:PilZ domain-containing protein [Shewanella sp. GutDb-MelDb]|uniref:PilZ domain-containing protein n=1 Tax=Shewanella sp. GutDb-MelDb TaxID=2058316 RepID=UPI000C7C444F|nr:PilZ domain-containing protein [Shewanella sp. GutDb-MelDb]PKG55018.1 PilZ domain-containing protein [Shewanella sp. GutDb-MelDb]